MDEAIIEMHAQNWPETLLCLWFILAALVGSFVLLAALTRAALWVVSFGVRR